MLFVQLHYDKGLTVAFANLVHSADVGVVQRRGRPCLPQKALVSLLVLGHLLR
jgi:hypothetical protein